MASQGQAAQRRLIAMLALPGENATAVRELLTAQASALAKEATRAGARLLLAGAVDDDPTAAAAGERNVAPVHGVIELTASEDATLLDVAAALPGLAPAAVDWSASAVAVGTPASVLGGDKALLLVLGANRLPTLSQVEFHRYWRDTHAELALSLLDAEQQRRMAYTQLHAEEEPSRRAAALTGAGRSDYDGVLEVGLDQFLDLPHATVPGFAEAIFEDEKHFADQAAEMRGGLLQVLYREDA